MKQATTYNEPVEVKRPVLYEAEVECITAMMVEVMAKRMIWDAEQTDETKARWMSAVDVIAPYIGMRFGIFGTGNVHGGDATLWTIMDDAAGMKNAELAAQRFMSVVKIGTSYGTTSQ